MIVGNEELEEREARELVAMIINDARDIAGQFHQLNRSDKFRANWPNEYAYAESEWRSFVQATLQAYAESMGDPRLPERDKRRLFLARLLWAQVEAGAPEAYAGVAIRKGSEQFAGDAFENRQIVNRFGRHSNTVHELALPHRRYH